MVYVLTSNFRAEFVSVFRVLHTCVCVIRVWIVKKLFFLITERQLRLELINILFYFTLFKKISRHVVKFDNFSTISKQFACSCYRRINNRALKNDFNRIDRYISSVKRKNWDGKIELQRSNVWCNDFIDLQVGILTLWKLRLANYCLETDQLAYTMEDIGVNNVLNELRTFIDTCQIISRLVEQAHNNELPIIDCSNVINKRRNLRCNLTVDIKWNKNYHQFIPRKLYI